MAAAERTGQSFVSPEAIWVMESIFSSFFCFSKVRDAQSENSSSLSLWSMSSPFLKNLMLRNRRIVVRCCLAAGTLRYLQDLHAKKIASLVSCETVIESSEISFRPILAMTDIGTACWCLSAGSAFLKPR